MTKTELIALGYDPVEAEERLEAEEGFAAWDEARAATCALHRDGYPGVRFSKNPAVRRAHAAYLRRQVAADALKRREWDLDNPNTERMIEESVDLPLYLEGLDPDGDPDDRNELDAHAVYFTIPDAYRPEAYFRDARSAIPALRACHAGHRRAPGGRGRPVRVRGSRRSISSRAGPGSDDPGGDPPENLVFLSSRGPSSSASREAG
jgi:hypothetical protein